jgi:N-acetylglucosamine malate deacetylase 1
MSQERVVLIAAHPDDETLGAGGTLCRHVNNGDQVHVICATDGVTARHQETGQQEQCLRLAMQHLGISSVQTLSLPDQRLDSLPLLDIIQPLEDLLQSCDPTILYIHAAGDVNQDHRTLHQACLVLARPLPGRNLHTLRCFEVPSSTEWTPPGTAEPFSPNCFVDISYCIEDKLAALEVYKQAYQNELPQSPHPRSLEMVQALAQRRAIESGTGQYAEAFMTLRQQHHSKSISGSSGAGV